jgi:hypothetical protein
MPLSIYPSLLILHRKLCDPYNWESAFKYSYKQQKEKTEDSKEEQIKSRRSTTGSCAMAEGDSCRPVTV